MLTCMLAVPCGFTQVRPWLYSIEAKRRRDHAHAWCRSYPRPSSTSVGNLMLAGVAMLHWFCTSALSTCGSVLLCSIVYYPRDGFFMFSVQCGLRSVQIKYCSIYGGQEQHGRACCEA